MKILILEDSQDDLELLERELRRGGINFLSRVAYGREDFEKALHEFFPDIILSDHSLPQFNSADAMAIWKNYQQEKDLTIPFILITGSVSEEFAVESMKSGADDYILKDRLKRLPSSIKSALSKARLERERVNFHSQILLHSNLMKEAEHLARFGSWQVDLRTGKQEWSDEAFRIFGFTPGDIDPDYEKFFRHVHPDDRAALRHVIEVAVNHQQLKQCEYRIVDNNGTIKTVLSRIIVKRDASGRAFQLIGFTLDITDQKKQTVALETQNQKLMEIAWVQSHEVRAPLARLLGLVQLLARSEEGNKDSRQTMEHIIQSANELDEIIRKIVRKTEEIV